MNRRVRYEPTTCHTALNRVQGMAFGWSLNPYQGCVHGCHYCYARRYHAFHDLDPGRDFESVIFVKRNVHRVLRQELRRPQWRREQVAVGTATDPYQPIEGRERLTRRCLQAFLDHETPISLITKGTLVVRDRDLLADLGRGPGASVCVSLTTLDLDLWRKLEPGTPPPSKRLWAMERLVASGIRAGVLLAPILPGLTDDHVNLETVVRAAADHGAQFLGTQVLYLKAGTREHFLAFLSTHYPDLLKAYQRLYPGPFAPKRFQHGIKLDVERIKVEAELVNQPAPPRRCLEQLELGI